jgi:hypothetical protein
MPHRYQEDQNEIPEKCIQRAKSFDIHPAVIMFPEYEAKEIEKAA